MKNIRNQHFPQDVPMPGGAVPRGEVCKTGEAPARGAARSAAGGRRRRPKAGDAFRGGGTRPVPLTQNLRGGIRHFPRKTSRGTRPARPAGGGTNAFCFPSLVAPAPLRRRNCPFPAPRGEILFILVVQSPRATPAETLVPRPARVRFSALPRYNHRAPRLRKLSFPDPRGCYPIVFRKTIPARIPP